MVGSRLKSMTCPLRHLSAIRDFQLATARRLEIRACQGCSQVRCLPDPSALRKHQLPRYDSVELQIGWVFALSLAIRVLVRPLVAYRGGRCSDASGCVVLVYRQIKDWLSAIITREFRRAIAHPH